VPKTQCTICLHEKRDEIEAAILKGESQRSIASQYNVSQSAVGRHKKNGHIRTEVVEVPAPVIERVHTVDPLSELERYRQKLDSMLERAETEQNWNEARATIREIRESIKVELVARTQLRDERRDFDPITAVTEIGEILHDYDATYKPKVSVEHYLLDEIRKRYE